MVSSYLPDECWEYIFRFIIDEDDNHNRHYLNSLSLVSKQFLSITNRLLFSLTIYDGSTKFLPLFKRFPNLNSLNHKRCCCNNFLIEISLSISDQKTFPTNGLRAFSQKITTLTSLTCSNIGYLSGSHLFLIAECFPLLQELDLSSLLVTHYTTINYYFDGGVEALSLALIKLRKVNLSGLTINDQSLFNLFKNCKQLEEVVVFRCHKITSVGLASALRERPTLRSLSFSITSLNIGEVFTTSQFIDSLVSLKGLTCLVLHNLNISNNLLYSIAKEGLPLTRLDFSLCNSTYSYAGILCLLSNCQRIQHLNLQGVYFLEDQHVFKLSLYLGDLVSINLSYCWKLTYSALFALVRNCPSLSEIKMESIQCVENSDFSADLSVYTRLNSLYLGDNSGLSDEIIAIFASIFPNLKLLNLNSCSLISEGICQVLRKCCKIRHLNLEGCSRVKLLGMNFVVSNLEVLNLSYTKVDDETLYVISKNCCGLSRLLLGYCKGVTEKAVKRVLENRTQLRVEWSQGS